MRARAVLFASAALVAAGSALSGCGGSLSGGTGGGGTGGTGGAGATGRGGAGATGRGGGGTGGTGGNATAGTGGAGSDFGQPACPSEVTLAAPCTPADLQLCYKTCGVESIGVRSETCRNGTYNQMSGCSFDPSRDYSCYKIPTAANAACPTGVTPMASMACDVPYCTLCNSLQGTIGGQYLDSGGAPKVGWCVCKQPNAAGMRTWSCASDTSWPCPLGIGCGATGAPFVSEPACLSTVVAGAACTWPTDQGYCYKPCGPQNSGVREEVCMLVYLERGCTFDPDKNYSCYKIPASANVACPAGVTPQSATACDVPACTLCNSLGGAASGLYLDAASAIPRPGYCVCQPPDANGTRTWSCASDMEWPCPRGQGC